eukprot:15365127-Ditylum_brightwellii.AAC.3
MACQGAADFFGEQNVGWGRRGILDPNLCPSGEPLKVRCNTMLAISSSGSWVQSGRTGLYPEVMSFSRSAQRWVGFDVEPLWLPKRITYSRSSFFFWATSGLSGQSKPCARMADIHAQFRWIPKILLSKAGGWNSEPYPSGCRSFSQHFLLSFGKQTWGMLDLVAVFLSPPQFLKANLLFAGGV